MEIAIDKQTIICRLVARDLEIARKEFIITRLHLQLAVIMAFPPGVTPSSRQNLLQRQA